MEKNTKPSLFQLSACTYLLRKRMRESMDRGSNRNGKELSSPHWSLARRVPCRSESTMFRRTVVRWDRNFPKRDAITSQDHRTSVGGTFLQGSCGFTGPRPFTIDKSPPSIHWAILCHWRRLVRVGPSPSIHCTSTWASSHNPSIEIRFSPLHERTVQRPCRLLSIHGLWRSSVLGRNATGRSIAITSTQIASTLRCLHASSATVRSHGDPTCDQDGVRSSKELVLPRKRCARRHERTEHDGREGGSTRNRRR